MGENIPDPGDGRKSLDNNTGCCVKSVLHQQLTYTVLEAHVLLRWVLELLWLLGYFLIKLFYLLKVAQ